MSSKPVGGSSVWKPAARPAGLSFLTIASGPASFSPWRAAAGGGLSARYRPAVAAVLAANAAARRRLRRFGYVPLSVTSELLKPAGFPINISRHLWLFPRNDSTRQRVTTSYRPVLFPTRRNSITFVAVDLTPPSSPSDEQR